MHTIVTVTLPVVEGGASVADRAASESLVGQSVNCIPGSGNDDIRVCPREDSQRREQGRPHDGAHHLRLLGPVWGLSVSLSRSMQFHR